MKIKFKLVKDDSNNNDYNYQLLGRLKSDCEYFLNHGRGHEKHLWAGDVKKQISKMKEIYNKLTEKPEWLTLKDIENYEKRMLNYKKDFLKKDFVDISSWVCKYWPTDSEDRRQLDNKINQLGLRKKLINGNRDAEIIGKRSRIEAFMSWLSIGKNRFSEIKNFQDSFTKDSYSYEFPSLTEEDIKEASKYNLKVVKKSKDFVVLRGNLSNLKSFAKNWIGYQLVESYLTKDANDPLSNSNLKKLFEKYNNDEDKVINHLRKLNLDISNSDLQAIVEGFNLTRDSLWNSYTLKKGIRTDAFKQYLRDRGFYFEASEDGQYTYFKVKNADEGVDRRVDEIIRQLKDSSSSIYKIIRIIKRYDPEGLNIPNEPDLILEIDDLDKAKNELNNMYRIRKADEKYDKSSAMVEMNSSRTEYTVSKGKSVISYKIVEEKKYKDSIKDGDVEPSLNEINQIKQTLGTLGFIISSEGKTLLGRKHLQILSKKSGYSKEEFEKFMDNEFEKFYDFVKNKMKIDFTYSVGLHNNGQISGGLDFSKWVNDKVNKDSLKKDGFKFKKGDLKIGQKIKYSNKIYTILDLEWDEKYGHDILIEENGIKKWIGNGEGGNYGHAIEVVDSTTDSLEITIDNVVYVMLDYRNAYYQLLNKSTKEKVWVHASQINGTSAIFKNTKTVDSSVQKSYIIKTKNKQYKVKAKSYKDALQKYKVSIVKNNIDFIKGENMIFSKDSGGSSSLDSNKEHYKNSIEEMNKYVRNWDFMSAKERNEVMPGASKAEGLKRLKERIEEYKKNLSEDSLTDSFEYLGRNANRKLSFYKIKDSYVAVDETTNIKTEIDKECIAKALNKNINDIHNGGE